MRGRDVFLLLTGAVFLLGGLTMVATGETVTGAMSACFGAVALSVPIAGLLPDGSGPRLEPPALVIAVGRGRRVLLTVGAVLFAATSALLIVVALDDGNVVRAVAGTVGVVTFGGFALVGLWKLRGPFRLVLLPTGVRWDYGRPGALVPWDEVDRAWILSQSGNRTLCIEAPRSEASGTGLIARANRALGGGDVNVPLDQTGLDPERVLATVAAYAESPSSRAEIGTEASLRRLTA